MEVKKNSRKRKVQFTNRKQSVKALISLSFGLICCFSCAAVLYMTYQNGGQARLNDGAVILVCLFFGGIGFLQLVFRKSLAKVDKVIIAVGVLYVIVIALYVIFEKIPMNFRPVIMPGETEPEASFPSSHTLLAMTVFGSAPWVLDDFFPEENYRRIYKPVFYALAVITVIGRLLSGVHWFTDIIAAALISLTLLEAFKAALDEIK